MKNPTRSAIKETLKKYKVGNRVTKEFFWALRNIWFDGFSEGVAMARKERGRK